ncbi:hypothetical protein [Blastococcus sp. TF02A-26]|uniref:hypothetical protein n=1 Tax=Blastococcus sp. TF02A-26 TaxID=2250577 RepID=UPI000DEA68FC|nr:hypothetical protein [Blastococcus sp. TF02A-26]RBY86809.1 hypothetical protein DQ240_08365 [Blastococcus sp. TF02A-26]
MTAEFRYTREEAERDRIGWCRCGLSGRQRHRRVTATGVEPPLFVRSDWVCRGTWPGEHLRRN